MAGAVALGGRVAVEDEVGVGVCAIGVAVSGANVLGEGVAVGLADGVSTGVAVPPLPAGGFGGRGVLVGVALGAMVGVRHSIGSG